jgi:hypothetical protein
MQTVLERTGTFKLLAGRRVGDLGQGWHFIVDSQDVAALRESCGLDDKYPAYFALLGDGEYEAVYGITNTVPYVHLPLNPVYPLP